MDEILSLEREIFISYAWRGESESFVDRLDQTLQAQGITIIRDKRDLGYKGRIKTFMERIGRGKYVIAVISDRYLKSPNCMFELVQIAKNGDFYDRIFPVVLTDADIYRPVQRLQYVKYWEQEIKALDEAMKEVGGANLQGFREEIDEYTDIRNTIAEIVSTLKDMNTLTADLHSDADFEALRNAIDEQMQRDGQPMLAEPVPKPPVIPDIPLVNPAQEQYRQQVRDLITDGKISSIGLDILEHLRADLNLSPEIATQIQNQELDLARKPIRNRKIYQQWVKKVIDRAYPLTPSAERDLDSAQQTLGISDRNVEQIKQDLFFQKQTEINRKNAWEAEIRRQQVIKQRQKERERESLWQQIKQQMQGISYNAETQKYSISYNPLLWEQLNALPDDLRSDKGIDYEPLRDLLNARKWQEADQETYRVMLRAANREEQCYLNKNSIDNFSCADLQTIDQLWVKYSQGHFGFSIQKQIWLKCGGKVDGETEKKLGDALRWREQGRWEFNMIYDTSQSVLAHLPLGLVQVGWSDFVWVGGVSVCFHTKKCNL